MAKPSDFIIVFVVIAFGAQIACDVTSANHGFNNPNCGSIANKILGDSKVTIFENVTISSGSLATVGAVILAGTAYAFPNPYAIFSPIFLLLMAMTIFPVNAFATVIQSLPAPFTGFIIALLSFLFALAVLGWFKGTET